MTTLDMKRPVRRHTADSRQRANTRTLTCLILIVSGLFYLFAQGAKDHMLTLVRSLADPAPECTYIIPPSLSVLDAESVRISWRSSCRHSATLTINSGKIVARVVAVGPLDSWFEYAADLPVAYGKPTQILVETNSWALNRMPPISYTSPWSAVAQNVPRKMDMQLFAIGLADTSRISSHMDEPWATALVDIMLARRLSFVWPSETHLGNRNIPRVVRGPPDSKPFAAFAGNVCLVSASIGRHSGSLEAVEKCAGADHSVVLIDMDWIHRLLFWLGTTSSWQSGLLNRLSNTSDRTKALMLRSGSSLVPLDPVSLRPLTPKCTWLGQLSGLCARPVATIVEQTASGGLQLSTYTVSKGQLLISKSPIF